MRPSLGLVLGSVVTLLLVAVPAAADEPAAPAAVATSDTVKDAAAPPDYRPAMMLTDLLLTGAFAGSWTLGRADAISPGAARAGAIASFAGFVGSGALYHQAFDLRKKTALSIVVRTLAPLVFGGAVAANVHRHENRLCKKRGISSDDCDHDGTETGALVGALIGMLGATVAEATILVPDGRKPLPRPAAGLSVSPSAAWQPGGGQVGIVGIF